ncbi:MAG: hypothetical protein AAGD10_09885 [Myxococcota bacterium]
MTLSSALTFALLLSAPSPGENAVREVARADFVAQRADFLREHDAWVQLHLHRAESLLRQRDVSDWSPERRLRREQSLDALEAYWQEGAFPWSDSQKFDAPIFVDDDGTHCAVAHILRSNGLLEMVEKIRQENNLGYVAEIAEMPGVIEAVSRSGLEPEEAAYVQPAYGYCSSFAERFCLGTGGPFPEPSMVRARVVQATESGYLARIENELWGPSEELEETFVLDSDFRQNFFQLEVGDGLLVTFSDQHRIVSVLGQNEPGGEVRLIDEPCEAGLSIVEQEAAPRLRESYENCLRDMELAEPEWVRGFCVQGFADTAFSCPESELLEYEVGEEEPPVAPKPDDPVPSRSGPGELASVEDGGCRSIPPSTLGLLSLGLGLLVHLRRRKS